MIAFLNWQNAPAWSSRSLAVIYLVIVLIFPERF